MLSFILGVVLGLVVGAGLVIWFAPKNKNHMAMAREDLENLGKYISNEGQELYQKIRNKN